jgi:septal ring factor EnvC (AmiA/AmiB activator)
MKIAPVVLALGAALVIASPAAAVTPKQQIAKLRSQLAAAKKANTKLGDRNLTLDAQRQGAQSNLKQVNAELDTANATIAKMTTDAATAAATQAAALQTSQSLLASTQAANTALQAAVSGNIGQLAYPQLWPMLLAISARFSALGGTAYTTSIFTGSSFADIDFTHYGP